MKGKELERNGPKTGGEEGRPSTGEAAGGSTELMDEMRWGLCVHELRFDQSACMQCALSMLLLLLHLHLGVVVLMLMMHSHLKSKKVAERERERREEYSLQVTIKE